MSGQRKNLSNPFSTGGGGPSFEVHVQASFVALMLAGGFAPGLPRWPIKKIKLQGRFKDWDTDDLIVFVEDPSSGNTRRMLGQIKHSIGITKNNAVFGEVIQAAWNDFNNPSVFDRDRDIIALITGPLTTVDVNHVHPILEWAKQMENAEEFVQAVELANFSDKKKREKLQAFREQLNSANGGIPVTDESLFQFLRHFHLFSYDLDLRAGVYLSLLHSIVGQYVLDDAHGVWARIIDVAMYANQNAGTISRESLPDDLVDLFIERVTRRIPEEYLPTIPEPDTKALIHHQYARELVTASLIGAWDESSEADRGIVEKLSGIDYPTWIVKIREVLQLSNSPLSLRNGKWTVTNRESLWNTLGQLIFDSHLDKLKECAVIVLKERDPKFTLPPNERFAAAVRGKVLAHSEALRQGLAESLALLYNEPQSLVNCSQDRHRSIAILSVREIFDGADWILWGSLNNLLPTLAEAAPDAFLDVVESALYGTPGLFDDLFAQEGDAITGGNYLTGLLWALEGLAWDEQYLVGVCVALGGLASHDPGGNWMNRPINSLMTILLPWYPQTLASIEKREVAVRTLCKEWPDVCWDLIIRLLPNQHQSTMGSHKPSWRKVIPDDWTEGVSNQEYRQQVSFYADLAVSMADQDVVKLAQLIDHFDKLPKPSFDKLLDELSSDTTLQLPEKQRFLLWTRLTKFIARHRLFADTKWALGGNLVSALEDVAQKIAPSDPFLLYQHLFTDRDFELYEERDNREEQRQKLMQRRQDAVRELLQVGGIENVIQFAETVAAPRQVGSALGDVADPTIDSVLLPEFLDTESRSLAIMISGYVWSRHTRLGWSWADGMDKSSWNNIQIGSFLSLLPFNEESWERAERWLGKSQEEYWTRTPANPHQTEGNLRVAIDKLLEYGRPLAAIDCLYRMAYDNQPLDISQCVRALLAALNSTESVNSMDRYQIVELIKLLQTNSDVSQDDLFRIEWGYLPLLDHELDAAPKLLESRLASDPEFFCEALRLVYRSRHTAQPQQEPDERSKIMAERAWRLLHEWQTPPGIQADGTFSSDQFLAWLRRVKERCTETGHLEVALTTIGEVLIYAPADKDGLWIDQTIAEALNNRDAEEMRNGYKMGWFNSRGVHWVDPTGKPERDLAKQFRRKAEDVENAGFHRLSATLRSLADDYDREAERILADHQGENIE